MLFFASCFTTYSPIKTVSLLMKPEDDIMTLVVNSIRNDIISGNPDFQSLALAAIANIGGDNFAETLADDMHRLLTVRLSLFGGSR